MIPLVNEEHPGIDQSLLNFIGYQKTFKKFGINITIQRKPTAYYQSMTECDSDTTESEENGITINHLRPSLLHQYDRACKWFILISKKLCPPAGKWHEKAYANSYCYYNYLKSQIAPGFSNFVSN